MSIQDIYDVINAIIGSDPLQISVSALFVTCVAVGILCRLSISSLYKRIIAVAVFVLAIVFVAYRLNVCMLFATALLFFFVCMAAFGINYFGCRNKLKKIVEYADSLGADCDYVEALSVLKTIEPSRLTCKQLACFKRYRIYCHFYLGNNTVAKNMLEDDTLEPVFRHFALHVIADAACDYKTSRMEIETATANLSNKTDPLMALQLDCNRAFSHIVGGRFKTADEELEKVLASVHANKIKNKTFLNLLYTNMVLNKARVGLPDGGVAAGQQLIDEYASTLSSCEGGDLCALFNLQLMFCRQHGIKGAEQTRLYFEEIETVLENEHLTEQKRMVVMASLLSVAWSDGLDPLPVLRYFDERFSLLLSLQPEQRYYVYKNLNIVLTSFAADDSFVTTLREKVEAYLSNESFKDLDVWEKGLPQEAIKIRAQVYSERASMYQLLGADSNTVVTCLKEAIDLLEDGMQVKTAIDYRCRLARFLAFDNQVAAKEQLVIIEEQLGLVEGDPLINHLYYELCLCYAFLGLRRECRAAYLNASMVNMSMGHYAPNVRADKAMAMFCARFFLLLENLESCENLQNHLLTEEGKAWVTKYPSNNLLAQVILCGKFLGYEEAIPVCRRTWENKDGDLFASFCLIAQDLGLAFDINVMQKDGSHGLVCPIDKQSLISDNSGFEQVLARQGMVVYPPEYKNCTEQDLDNFDKVAVRDILDALAIVTKKEQPSLVELKAAYREAIADCYV